MANQGGGSAAGDIEVQLFDNVSEAASTNSDHPNTTHASPIQENPNITTRQDDVRSCKGFLARHISLISVICTLICRFLWIIVKALLLSLIVVFYILLCFYLILIDGKTDYLYDDGYAPDNPEEDDRNKIGHCNIKMRKATIKVKIHRLTIVTAVRMGCLVLLWMVINLKVAHLRSVAVLGSPLWKWSLLAALVLLAYPMVMCLLYSTSAIVVEVLFTSNRRSNMQYYMEGIAEGLILALYSTSLLLAWLLCVDTTNAQLHRYGTLALVSLLVGGVLSLLKSSVLLWWRTKLIYIKYREKILSAGCHFYFNLLFMDQNYGGDVLVGWLVSDNYTPQEFVPIDPKSKDIEGHKGCPNGRKIPPIEKYMLKKGASIKHVHEVATYLTKKFELRLTEDDDIPDIVPYLRSNFPMNHGPGYSLMETHPFIGELDVKLLIEQLQLETSEKNPPYADFEKWMVDGLKYCYAVGNRIDGAFEVMRILSRVMTTFIVVVVILVWLFITGFATTKVVVGLASIFLGLSFAFGDAFKIFFQGVIFSFVTHPFDVGDLCIIDDKELKVKKINILTTTFFGSQSKDVILYPNSDLSTKRIMLLNGERESESKPEREAKAEAAADLSDLVEFTLPPKTTSLQIGSLQDTIERHLEGGVESGVYKNSYCVSLMEFGDSIRMSVDFEHVLSEGDKSEHSESIVMRKKKQRSKLVLRLKKFVEDMGNDV